MCGIVGVKYLNGRDEVRPEQLRAMNGRIFHRGPDGGGEKSFGACGIAMRRLSIIDLSSGQQPMCNEDGTVWVVFNGEIYNFQEARSALTASGHRFRTSSDTEVLVHGYEEYGLDFVRRLDGMFGFALWDDRRKRLVLGRDRVGIKPLYYYQDDSRLVFASEVKALLALDEVPREVDPGALDEFMTLEYVLAPKTLLKGVRKLQPGHLLVSDPRGISLRRYWTPPAEPASWTEEEAAEAVRGRLTAAVKSHLVSEVPLGAFLSGGIDSSIIVGLMAGLQSRPVKTFSIGFEEASYNELDYARLVSRHFNTEHHEFILKPDPVTFLDDFIRYLDEPIGDVSVFPTFLVSQKTRTRVTVALSGDGGDELFGGYDTYLAERFDRWYRLLPSAGRKALSRWAERVPPTGKKKGLVNRIKRFVEGAELPREIRQYRWMSFLGERDRRVLYRPDLLGALEEGNAYRRLREVFEDTGAGGTDLNRQILADLQVYLPEDILAKVDITSMANSLETRVPFLDHHVVELALSLPDDLKIRGFQRKYILKKAFAGLLPRPILGRRKEGFSIPLKNWLRGELRDTMREVLAPAEIRRLGYFDAAAVERLIGEHLVGAQNHAHRLWCLMVFHLWHRKFIGDPGARACDSAETRPLARQGV